MDSNPNNSANPANSTDKPMMCKNNCGFCGSVANENYCSLCYKEYLRVKLTNNSGTTATPSNITGSNRAAGTTSSSTNTSSSGPNDPTPNTSTNSASTTDGTASSNGGGNTTQDASSGADPTTVSTTEDKSRCFLCRKKIGLLGFSCRCNHTFCSQHRMANLHDCSFDYKNYNKMQLERKSVKIIPDKISKI